jgi:hypothetical protein
LCALKRDQPTRDVEKRMNKKKREIEYITNIPTKRKIVINVDIYHEEYGQCKGYRQCKGYKV